MTLSSQVPFSIGQSQFHAFKSLSVLIFFRFSEFEIPRNIIYVFFFLLPSIASGHFVAEILQKLLWKSTPSNISPYELVRRAN